MHRAFRAHGRQRRAFSAVVDTLKSKIQALADKKAPQLTALRKVHQVFLRVPDQDCMDQLPKAPGSNIGLPEASFWLLLTDEMPSDADVKDTHPMTQLSMGLLALQPTSAFGKALSLVAKVPVLAARIFRNVFMEGKHIPSDPSLDWAGNYAQMLGKLFLSPHFPHWRLRALWRYWQQQSRQNRRLRQIDELLRHVVMEWLQRVLWGWQKVLQKAGLELWYRRCRFPSVSDDALFKDVTRLYLMLHADHEAAAASGSLNW
eukprot:Skav224370  [mRNA]  locus=scaffold2603:12606:21219:+ [translate_table: standard]